MQRRGTDAWHMWCGVQVLTSACYASGSHQLILCLAYAGAHYPERPSTLYPWANPCPDWAIFRHVFPANVCLRCGPHITEINAEKNDDQSEVPHPSSVFLDRFWPFPRWFRPFAGRSRDRRSRETILKIAQSGHGLSLRLSIGDGRSG